MHMANAPVPRHACPTLAEPMRTGDGYLARLPPLLAPLTPRQLAGIADAARMHGNGLVEISRRGNWQIRGLSADGGPALQDALAALGLDLPGGPPISADGLLPREKIVVAEAFADALRHRLTATGLSTRLAPKIALVLDFASRFAPTTLSADVRVALTDGRAHVAIGGDAQTALPLGAVPEADAADAVIAILGELPAYGPFARLAGAGCIRHAPDFAAALAARPGYMPAHAWSRPLPPALPGGSVAQIAFPFGQIAADALAALARLAEANGIDAVTSAPDRRLLLAGPGEAVAQIAREAAQAGFVVAPDDPRQSVFACIGAAGCASGMLPTRTIAAELAQTVPALLDGSFHLHVSGCAKGCAHPEPCAISFAALDKSLAIVLEGRPRDAARGIVPAQEIASRLSALAAAVERERRSDETAAAVLERLGAARVGEILLGTSSGREDGSRRDGRKQDGRTARLPA